MKGLVCFQVDFNRNFLNSLSLWKEFEDQQVPKVHESVTSVPLRRYVVMRAAREP